MYQNINSSYRFLSGNKLRYICIWISCHLNCDFEILNSWLSSNNRKTYYIHDKTNEPWGWGAEAGRGVRLLPKGTNSSRLYAMKYVFFICTGVRAWIRSNLIMLSDAFALCSPYSHYSISYHMHGLCIGSLDLTARIPQSFSYYWN